MSRRALLAVALATLAAFAAVVFMAEQRSASVREDRAELQTWAVDQWEQAQEHATVSWACSDAARDALGVRLSGVPVVTAAEDACRHVYEASGVVCLHQVGNFDQVEVELIKRR